MKKNPFLKAEEKVIRQLYGNSATLTYRNCTKSYNSSTGEMSESIATFTRTIYISSPSEFADIFVDGENIQKGDITCEVARETLTKAMQADSGDVGTLGRTDSLMRAGLDPDSDRITIGGRDYRIVKIQAKNIYTNEPAIYKLHLREVK